MREVFDAGSWGRARSLRDFGEYDHPVDGHFIARITGALTGASVLADGNFDERCMVNFRVYADRNYWTTAGWEDYVVPDPHESKRGWEGGVARNTCWRGESAGASIARV